jgi:hypothetical protein
MHYRLVLQIVAAWLVAAAVGGCGGGGGGSDAPAPPGGGGGGPVATYGNTTLPGRLLVNGVPGLGKAAAFDLRTAQRVLLPQTSTSSDADRWSSGARASSVLRYARGASQTAVTALDAASFSAVQATLTLSNDLSAPLLSADGRYLLSFWYDQSAGQTTTDRKLTIFDLATGAVVKRVSNLDGVSVLSNPAAWLPDGRYVYLAGKSLFFTSPAITTATEVPLALPDPTPSSVSYSSIAVSPDGSKVALSWRQPRGVSNDVHLWVANTDGTGLTRLTNPPDATSPLDYVHGSPTWSPDGSWVAGVLYMSGTSAAPVYPDEPFLGARITGSTGCVDQVFVVNAAGPAIALSWPSFDARLGIKVAAPSGTGGQWLATCGGTVSWLP